MTCQGKCDYIQNIMEFLQALYQQRLDSLAKTFLRMLQQLQTTVSPFSEPMLAPYRVQYLQHIITTTLKDQREKFIAQLSQQISELRTHLNRKSHSSLNLPLKDYSITTGSRESIYERDLSELHLKSPKLSGKAKKVTSLKNPHYLQQTYFDGESSLFDDNGLSKIKQRRKDRHSSTSIKLQNMLKSGYEMEEKDSEDEEVFELKYQKMNKNNNKRQ